MTFTHALATNNYGPAKFIVSANIYEGTHTTIASALTSASSGDTIFIRPGTYTENLTLKAGVNLTAYVADASLDGTGHVIIKGNATLSTAGSVSISGIQLQTNAAAFLTVSGSAASIVNITNCYLNCLDATGISYSSSSSSSQINLYYCTGNLGTTGIGLYSMSSTGVMNIEYSEFTNSGASTTATTNSAGNVQYRFSTMQFPVSYSSTGLVNMRWCNIFTQTINTTSLTTAGNQNSTIQHCKFLSGTASSISIGSGTVVQLEFCSIENTNANAITGAGTLIHGGITFTSTGTTSNATTQTAATFRYGYIRSTLQPGFLAFAGSVDSNVTGAGATYTLGSGNALTEVFDQNGDFNTNGTFTAPITGRYYLQYTQSFGGITSAMTQGLYRIVTSNRTYNINLVNTFSAGTAGNNYTMNGSVYCDMDAADTATFTTVISNGAGDTADTLVTSGGAERTYVSGFMLC